jgi:hypothetical protein
LAGPAIADARPPHRGANSAFLNVNVTDSSALNRGNPSRII